MAKDTTLLVATVRNEGPNILEWVAHHRLCGFDRIQIHLGECFDTTSETLSLLDQLGVIELHNSPDNTGVQQAYREASRSLAYAKSDWCMTLDADEFLNVKAGDGKVQDLIRACPADADAILVNWRVHGSAGHDDLSGELVTERFTRAEPAHEIVDGPKSAFKALARNAAFGSPGVNLPRDAKKKVPVFCNGSGLYDGEFPRMSWRSNDPLARRHGEVKHYMLRDLTSFLLKHARHEDANRETGLTYWQKHDRNDEEDLSFAKQAFALWAEMKRLDEMADGELLPLRQRAIRQWKEKLADVLKDKANQALRDAILAKAPALPPAQRFTLPKGGNPIFNSARSNRGDKAIDPKPAMTG